MNGLYSMILVWVTKATPFCLLHIVKRINLHVMMGSVSILLTGEGKYEPLMYILMFTDVTVFLTVLI